MLHYACAVVLTQANRRRGPRWPTLLALPAVVVLLLVGAWLGGHPEDLPSFLRSSVEASQQTAVLREAMQRIESGYYRRIPASQLTNASLSGMIASLDDRFSHYLTPAEFREFDEPPHFTGIGVAVGPERRGLQIVRVFNSSPAQRAGLKSGEVILSVDGRKLEGLSAEAAAALIKGEPGTTVVLKVEQPASRRGERSTTRTVRIVRATVSEPVVASEMRTVNGIKIGVVALAAFTPGAHAEVREAVEGALRGGAKGIVLDLRSNGGGLVVEAQLIASIFIHKGGVIVTMRGRTQPTQVLTATGGAIPSSVKMVVLVDHDTASAAEIVTAALQDHHRATVVGTHTFGKGVFQEEEELSNGGAIDITVGEYYTPDGRNLGGGGVKQGAGVSPEVSVPSGVDSEHGLEVALSTLAAKIK